MQGDTWSGDPIPVHCAGVSGRLWGTFLPAEQPAADGTAPRGVSILARDMQSVAIYDSRGQFVGIRRPDSGRPISVRPLSSSRARVCSATIVPDLLASNPYTMLGGNRGLPATIILETDGAVRSRLVVQASHVLTLVREPVIVFEYFLLDVARQPSNNFTRLALGALTLVMGPD